MKRYICKKKLCNDNYNNISQKKENILCSLNQVENFLCNCTKAIKCFKFYSLFK